MAAVDWNAGLPQHVLHNQFQENIVSGIIEDQMDTGFVKRRRRFTGTSTFWTIVMTMTPTEYALFKNFFRNYPGHPTVPGIAGGIERFNFPDPTWYPGSGETEGDRPKVEVRMVGNKGSNPYTATPDGDSVDWKVSFQLERLPS